MCAVVNNSYTDIRTDIIRQYPYIVNVARLVSHG